MLINSIKDLDKLMQLARKRGISELTVDGIKFVLDYTQGPSKTSPQQVFAPVTTDIDTPDLPSEEDLLFYSSGGTIGPGSYQSPAWQAMNATPKNKKAKTASNET